jgi:hypothetical protein
MMTKHTLLKMLGALALAALCIAVVYAQQAPAPAPQQQPAPAAPTAPAGGQQQQDNTFVLIAGENPAITYRNAPGRQNPVISEANFWHVSWSPFGSGFACFVIVNDPAPNTQKFVITDNPKMAEFIAEKVLGRLIKGFNDPPYKIMQGTYSQQIDGAVARTDICKSGDTTVEMKYMGMGEPRWETPGFSVNMSLVIVPVGSAEFLINGKHPPGAVASGFMSVNETWRPAK